MKKAYTHFMKNYCFGWIIYLVANTKMVDHRGNIAGFSSVLVRIPTDDVCIVLLNNQEDTELGTIARKILDIIYDCPYGIAGNKVAITPPDSTLSHYTGTYELTNMQVVADIPLENYQLIVQVQNGPPSC